MKLKPIRLAVALAALAMAADQARAGDAPSSKTKTRNVVVMMSDGLRWQEVFTGADQALLNEKDGGVKDVAALKAKYDRDTPQARREALLPFVTDVIAKQGRLHGDVGEESVVTNAMKFSYPGYNEVFTGFGDPRIDSNDKIPNPNVTVFEWLNAKPEFQGKVVGFGTWDAFPFILNAERAGMKVVAGWKPSPEEAVAETDPDLRRILDRKHRDGYTFYAALKHIKAEKPRVTFIGLGETDGYAHGGKYDQYLDAAHSFDEYAGQLWKTLQAMPEYKDQTTLIVTVDHGRGDAPVGWKNHGAKVDGAERIWIGVLGPDTPAKGDASLGHANQNQIAATLAALLGHDYNAYQPKAGPVIPGAVGR